MGGWPAPAAKARPVIFDEGGHVERLDLGKLVNAVAGTPVSEAAGDIRVGAAGVIVADLGCEKFQANQFTGLNGIAVPGTLRDSLTRPETVCPVFFARPGWERLASCKNSCVSIDQAWMTLQAEATAGRRCSDAPSPK